MGANSSQPLEIYSPKMDDFAASQQLIAEGAMRHDYARDEHQGNSEAPVNNATEDTVKGNGTSPTSHGIEVPDSQIEIPSATTHAPISPPMTSSIAVPASVTLKKRTYKKGRRSIAAETTSPSPSPSEPRHIRALSPTELAVIEATPREASAPRKEDSLMVGGLDNTAEDIEAEATPIKRSMRKGRSILAQKGLSDPIEDDDLVDGRSQRVEHKLRRIKKTKPGQSSTPASTQDNIPSPIDKIMEMDGTLDKPVPRTPGSTGTTQKVGLIKALTTPSKTQTPSTTLGKKRRPYKIPSKPPSTSESRRRFSRKSQADTSITVADRALNTVRELHQPHDLRDNGEFTADEDELIRRAIRDYQDRHGLSTNELVEIIQWSSDVHDPRVARKRADWTQQEVQDEEDSRVFWEELKQTGLTRQHKQIRRRVRLQYHTYSTGAWTEEEDEQLKSLMLLHPRRWKLISLAMGSRSQTDIYNRWSDYLQHGESRNTSRWSEEEEQLLLRAITAVAQRDEDYRAETGKPSRAVYSDTDINWPQVCVEMGDIRSRLQCTSKWAQMKKRDPPVTIQVQYRAGRTPDPDEIVEPTPQKRDISRKRGALPSEDRDTFRKRGRPRKSEAIDGPGDSGQIVEPTPKKRGRPRKSTEGVTAKDASDATAPRKKRRKLKKSAPEVVEDDEDEAPDEGVIKPSELPSKRSPPGKPTEASVTKESEEHIQEHVSATPVPKSLHLVSRPRTPGVAQMRLGDKFDLIEAVADSKPENEEDIDWYHIKDKMKYSWSIRTLQAALKELLDLVKSQETFHDTVIESMQYLADNFTEVELLENYDPHQDRGTEEDNELADDIELNGNAGLAQDKGNVPAVNAPNTKSKRKASARDSLSRSRDAPTKRKKMKRISDTAS